MTPHCVDESGVALTEEEVAKWVNAYVVIQCGVRRMNPAGIRKVYLPGIQNVFVRDQVRNNFKSAYQSQDVQIVLRGFERAYRRMHPLEQSVKIAFGMDLALCSKKNMKIMCTFSEDMKNMELKQKRMFVVMCVGIYFMLRKSEHICKKDGSAAGLLRSKVTFLDYAGRPIPYACVGKPGYKAKKVCIPTTFSKTDHSGFGRRPWHIRQEEPRKKEVCIVQILEEWIASTRDNYGARAEDELYHVPGIERVTTYRLHQIMREAVLAYTGDKPVGRIATSHSLRYGGATMMASAGFPQYLIAHYGGWAEDSEVLRRYIVPSDESIDRVSSYMTDMALKQPSKHYIDDAFAVYQAQQALKGKAVQDGGKKRRRKSSKK